MKVERLGLARHVFNVKLYAQTSLFCFFTTLERPTEVFLRFSGVVHGSGAAALGCSEKQNRTMPSGKMVRWNGYSATCGLKDLK